MIVDTLTLAFDCRRLRISKFQEHRSEKKQNGTYTLKTCKQGHARTRKSWDTEGTEACGYYLEEGIHPGSQYDPQHT